MRVAPTRAVLPAAEVIGGIGLTFQQDVHRRSAEIGYWLGQPFSGRGIAAAALAAVSEYAFAEHDLVSCHGVLPDGAGRLTVWVRRPTIREPEERTRNRRSTGGQEPGRS